MIRRILIPVDFSENAANAARWGIALAAQLAVEALLVSVLDVSDLRVAMDAGLHGFETNADVSRQVNEWVDAQYAKIIPAGAANVRRDVRRGIVEKEIVTATRQYQPDLIVMGSTGIGGKGPLGSKTRYILNHCSVPVVVFSDEAARTLRT